jgi:AmmeMemoRadiSam system protein A
MVHSLSADQKRRLLAIARQTVEHTVREGGLPDIAENDPDLLAPGAAFVTLTEGGQLRGCIGHVEARLPLWRCVRDMAAAAATQDTRFNPVDPKELSQLDYEISVLFPMEIVENLDDIVVGRDGLMMEKGYYRGLLLPQVAVEWGWDREQFLSQTARKAGLPADAWRDSLVTIYKFQGIVFSEKELGEDS